MTTKFIHLRMRNPFSGQLEPTGGITVAYDIAADNMVSYSHSQCSFKDHYCRRIGRAVSSARLAKGINVLSFPKEEGVNIVEQIVRHHDSVVTEKEAA